MRLAVLAVLLVGSFAAEGREEGDTVPDALQRLKDEISSAEAEPEDEQPAEVDGEIEWNFEYIDADDNGLVTKLEYREALQRYHKDWSFMECVKQVDSIFERADFVSSNLCPALL